MATLTTPFRRFDSAPEVIRLAVTMVVGCPLSLPRAGDLRFEHGIDICHETARFWRNRPGPMLCRGDQKAPRSTALTRHARAGA